MFSVTFNEPKKWFKPMIETATGIIAETVLSVDPKKGLEITAMDLSHICLVHFHIDPEDCDNYEVSETSQLGINFDDLNKIFKRLGAKDHLTLTQDPTNKKIIVSMKPNSAKKARTFSLSLIDMDNENINLDSLLEMEFANSFQILTNNLEEAIKDAEIFSEVLQIEVKDDKVIFFTTGNIGDMEYVLEKDELEDVEMTDKSLGIFAISFLKNIMKASVGTNKVFVWTKSEAPLKTQFFFTDKSYMLFFLAPRVEEEEDEYDE